VGEITNCNQDTQKPDVREVIRQLRELRHGITFGSLSLREMIEDRRL
jgi:hypothetical protein